jgi:hypothetical protein
LVEVILSDHDSNLFSEVQLAQIATMMPHLIAQQKARVSDANRTSSPKSEVPPVSESSNSSNSLETQKGILRLAEFLKKHEKKEPKTPKDEPEKSTAPDRAKVILFKRISGPPLSQFMVKRAFETYAWVKFASQSPNESAVQINKYF